MTPALPPGGTLYNHSHPSVGWLAKDLKPMLTGFEYEADDALPYGTFRLEVRYPDGTVYLIGERVFAL